MDTIPTITHLHVRDAILSTTQADDRPIFDAGSDVSTCPKTFASENQMVDPEQIFKLLSVLGEPLQHAALRNAQTCQGPRLQMAVRE